MNASNDLRDAFNQIPPVTRWLFASAVVVTGLSVLNIISPNTFIFYLPLIVQRLQLWRLVTNFVYCGMGLRAAFNLYFIFKYSSDLEQTQFAGKTADYVWFLLLMMISQLFFGWWFTFVILSDALIMSLVYLWAQRNRDVTVTFMFGLRFKALYLPFVLTAYDLLLMGSMGRNVLGIVTAHAYYFLTDVYPASGGPRLLSTPSFLTRSLPNQGVTRGGFSASGVHMTAPRHAREPPKTSGVFTGKSRRLGS
ncbi:hypothetical protein BZG36_01259 [Bifiguratus adelaidae]|uniref:Derlin n=1 Tax=Bifiguratus adelaidae TaxID=1938954 RepID=A0A261Y5W5_9FUNG|nr:hypothetical protein BZG36_01259 [Bifiguratus adelaidae]